MSSVCFSTCAHTLTCTNTHTHTHTVHWRHHHISLFNLCFCLCLLHVCFLIFRLLVRFYFVDYMTLYLHTICIAVRSLLWASEGFLNLTWALYFFFVIVLFLLLCSHCANKYNKNRIKSLACSFLARADFCCWCLKTTAKTRRESGRKQSEIGVQWEGLSQQSTSVESDWQVCNSCGRLLAVGLSWGGSKPNALK